MSQSLEYLLEKREEILLCLDDADRRFKIGIGKMSEITKRVHELEETRNLALRKEFLIKAISYYEKINDFKELAKSLKIEFDLINADSREVLIYNEVVIGYKSMSTRKNQLEEERNFYVKDIEKVDEEIKEVKKDLKK